jgi:BirA family transcriptional regulator, biotin operon repressor / biotin---[acetyl-CoA-carboxylase] ligase
MDDALAWRGDDPRPLWVVADRQTGGRGRHGRSWDSPEGNLYASLSVRERTSPALAPQLGFVAGLALHDAVAEAAGLAAPRLALKWPNDLLLDSGKLAGILLERHARGGGAVIVIGFGVNVASGPADAPYPAAALRNAAPDLGAGALFEALAARFEQRSAAWHAAAQAGARAAFAALRADWLERAAGLGEPIRVRLPNGERHGRFEGLDPVGRLTLGTAHGRELIEAGDVLLPPAPSPLLEGAAR